MGSLAKTFWDCTCKTMFKILIIPIIISCFCCSTRQHSNCMCSWERLDITSLLDKENSALKSMGWNHYTVGLKVFFFINHTPQSCYILKVPRTLRKENTAEFNCFYGLLMKNCLKIWMGLWYFHVPINVPQFPQESNNFRLSINNVYYSALGKASGRTTWS